jgi:hypothetical protein
VQWRTHAIALQGNGTLARDGAWYRRGSFDDGSLLGSNQNEERQIDCNRPIQAAFSRFCCGVISVVTDVVIDVNKGVLMRQEILGVERRRRWTGKLVSAVSALPMWPAGMT